MCLIANEQETDTEMYEDKGLLAVYYFPFPCLVSSAILIGRNPAQVTELSLP